MKSISLIVFILILFNSEFDANAFFQPGEGCHDFECEQKVADNVNLTVAIEKTIEEHEKYIEKREKLMNSKMSDFQFYVSIFFLYISLNFLVCYIIIIIKRCIVSLFQKILTLVKSLINNTGQK